MCTLIATSLDLVQHKPDAARRQELHRACPVIFTYAPTTLARLFLESTVSLLIVLAKESLYWRADFRLTSVLCESSIGNS